MKNRPFYLRLWCAISGILHGFKTEKSFRTQCVCGLGAILLLCLFQPAPLWWAIFFIVIGLVLAFELMNTALESLIDRLHPAPDSQMRAAKDCAAGAVLVSSFIGLSVLVLFLLDQLYFRIPGWLR